MEVNLIKFRYSFFSGIDWEWKEDYIIAQDKDQVMSWINEECPRSYRRIPFKNKDEDSLVIEEKEILILPIKI